MFDTFFKYSSGNRFKSQVWYQEMSTMRFREYRRSAEKKVSNSDSRYHCDDESILKPCL